MPRTVLLIDDDTTYATLIQIEIQRQDEAARRAQHQEPDYDPQTDPLRWEVWHVVTMREARAWLAQQTPDLIMLDLLLPDTLGPYGSMQLAADYPEIPVIGLSNLLWDELPVPTPEEQSYRHRLLELCSKTALQLDPRGLLPLMEAAWQATQRRRVGAG